MATKERKIKLSSAHSIEIVGSGDSPKLRFKGNTKGCKPYSVEISLDDYDVKELIKASIGHFKKVEDEAINRLSQYRKTMNYTNSEVEINYKKPE